MKVSQIYITIALGIICLVLSITSTLLTRGNRELQAQAQAQQAEIAKASQFMQAGQTLLRDMAQLSLHNEKIRTVLEENGYKVQTAPSSIEQP